MSMKNPRHPGEIVRDAIVEGLGLSITAAARGLDVSRKHLTDLTQCRTRISPEMAIRLEKGLGSSADAWLRMQMAYDLAQAKKGEKSIRVKLLRAADRRQSARRGDAPASIQRHACAPRQHLFDPLEHFGGAER